ncbi:hypothetical protein K432DRAFT_392744 [Lepidopterella palustris CBS 459.81]|uniref:Uncharacterized protein n=1 Tax=Lepidopterella palustris CBS 459.81 TaxID=1314670 RepID=A0A8E2EB79_9PEZI|nr:hypothetical protein K432DRAFT_392744 [Lepidopterella palustris CBS 459.81]
MPTNGPRAPSAGALSALRQAALYGSLGVTAGASVLLAEERRRQICILQRIVDNGRIVKAHTRNIHALALAEAAAADAMRLEDHCEWMQPKRHPMSGGEIDRAYEKATHRRRRRRRIRMPDDEVPENDAEDAEKLPGNMKDFTSSTYMKAQNLGISFYAPEDVGHNATVSKSWRLRYTEPRKEQESTPSSQQKNPEPRKLEAITRAHRKELYDHVGDSLPPEDSSRPLERPAHITPNHGNHRSEMPQNSVKATIRRVMVSHSIIGSVMADMSSKTPVKETFKSLKPVEITRKPEISVKARIPDLTIRDEIIKAEGEQATWSIQNTNLSSRSTESHISSQESGTLPVAGFAMARSAASQQVSKKKLIRKLKGAKTPGKALEAFYLNYAIVNKNIHLPPLRCKDDVLYSTFCEKLKNENLDEVALFFLQSFPPALKVAGSRIADIATVLLQFATDSVLPGVVLSLFQRLQSWNQVSDFCVNSVQKTFLELLRTSREKSALLLFSRTIGQGAGFDNCGSIEELLDGILEDFLERQRFGRLLQDILTMSHYEKCWESRVHLKCTKLMEESRIEDAANVFVLAIHPNDASAQSLTLSQRLTQLALKLDLIKTVKNLSQWAQEIAKPDVLIVAQIIRSLAAEKDYRTLLNVYQKHRDLLYEWESSLAFSEDILPNICLAMAEAAPYSSAAQSIGSLAGKIQDNENCYHKCLEAQRTLLRRCWKETKNMNTVEYILRSILAHGGHQGPPLKLNDDMLYIRAEAGLVDQKLMASSDTSLKSSKQDLNTLGNAMLAHAVNFNWPAVDLLLEQGHEHGVLSVASNFCSRYFNPILREYCRHHDSRQVQRFVIRAIETYRIVPNQMTMDYVLQALIKDFRVSAFPDWMCDLRSMGFDLQINGWSVFNMVKRFLLEHRPKQKIIMGMAIRIYQHDEHLLSKELYSVVKDSIAFELSIPPNYQDKSGVDPDLERNLEMVQRWSEKAPALSHRKSILSEMGMKLALVQGRNEAILDAYKKSLDAGLADYDVAMEVAVEAGLRMNQGDPAASMEVIRRAKKLGLDVQRASAPLLFHHMANSKSEPEEIHAAVMDSYRAMEEHKLPPKHYIAVSAANHLLNRLKPRQAIQLLSEVYVSKWARDMPLDITAMTVFLRGYALMRNLNGIKWVVDTVLEKDMRLDKIFIRNLQQSRKPFRRELKHERDEDGTPAEKEEAINLRFIHWIRLCRFRIAYQAMRTHKLGNEIMQVINQFAPKQQRPKGVKQAVRRVQAERRADPVSHAKKPDGLNKRRVDMPVRIRIKRVARRIVRRVGGGSVRRPLLVVRNHVFKKRKTGAVKSRLQSDSEIK